MKDWLGDLLAKGQSLSHETLSTKEDKRSSLDQWI